MVRAQITIVPNIYRRAQAKAAALDISFAEYVRRLVASDLGEPIKAKPNISIMFDLCTSGEPTNIARDKDKMISQAVWEDYLRKTGRAKSARRGKRVKAGRR